MELIPRYPREHYQIKAGRYAFALRVLFGVAVDGATRERWGDLISFARELDTFLDEGDASNANNRADQVIHFLDNSSEVGLAFPALSADRLGPSLYSQVATLGKLVVRTSQQTKIAPDVSRYAQLRRAEGRYYADMITSVATPPVRAQAGYDRFARWLRPIGEVTNLANSILDLHDDYENGEIAFSPSARARTTLLGHTVLAALQSNRTAHEVID